jgi:hypothetical protein
MKLLVFFIATVALAITGCNYNTISSSYATREAAKGDIEHGWIPPVLPVSAVQIQEWHDIDLNVGHGTFAFGPSDAEQFRAALTSLPAGTPLRAYRVSRSKFERQGYMFYTHGDFDIAVDWSRHVGEFWLVYSR